MMSSFKKEFLNHAKKIKEENRLSKAIEEDKSKLLQEKNLEEYYRVINKDFLNEMQDVVNTINGEIANHMEAKFFEGRLNQQDVHFTIGLKEFPDTMTENFMILQVSSNFITIRSNHDVFERLNDLGDMDPSNIVSFPQKRGKKLLDDEDIKEAKDQFIKGAYELAKGFIL